jgi:hypothetical protein
MLCCVWGGEGIGRMICGWMHVAADQERLSKKQRGNKNIQSSAAVMWCDVSVVYRVGMGRMYVNGCGWMHVDVPYRTVPVDPDKEWRAMPAHSSRCDRSQWSVLSVDPVHNSYSTRCLSIQPHPRQQSVKRKQIENIKQAAMVLREKERCTNDK